MEQSPDKQNSNYYIATEWIHDSPDEPIKIYSEFDVEGYEQRKIEMFRDGRVQRSDAFYSEGTTELSYEPFTSIEDVNDPGVLIATSMAREDFEQLWQYALNNAYNQPRE